MQEVVDKNAEVVGGRHTVSVRPDARNGSCEVSLVLQPLADWLLGAANYGFCTAQFSQR